MPRHSSLELLAPVCRAQFSALATEVARIGLFVFETYREPPDQLKAFKRNASKARPFESAHQFGLAVDFVPRDAQDRWYWPDPAEPIWDALDRAAARQGLLRPIAWDRPHIEHPHWVMVRRATRLAV